MEKTSKKTKKYSLGRFWTRTFYSGLESCGLSSGMDQKRSDRFDRLWYKNKREGLTKREHCLILGYFRYFKSVGICNLQVEKWTD